METVTGWQAAAMQLRVSAGRVQMLSPSAVTAMVTVSPGESPSNQMAVSATARPPLPCNTSTW